MPDAESFVAAIAANPADDLPRLVFADWLDENGDPTRAGFIRDHIQLAKTRPGTDEYKTLFRKCAETLKANLPAWIKPACDAFGQPAEWKPGKALAGRFGVWTYPNENPRLILNPVQSVEFARGLIERFELVPDVVRKEAAVDNLLRLQPITHLVLIANMHEQAWQFISTPRLRSVRWLSYRVQANDDATYQVFNSPHLEQVKHMHLFRIEHIRRLARSSIAKQLSLLAVCNHRDVPGVLSEFPLDDRLQEFKLFGSNSREVQEQVPSEYWGWISTVSFRPTLKRLDLTRCGMTDDGLAAFARGEEWVRLQGLKLGGNLFGDRGWADFCRGWRTPELTYLDASRNRLTDAGAEMLSRSGMLKTLRVIDLRGNRIAGRGAVTLARAVADGKLNRLLLAGNPVANAKPRR